MKKFKTSVVISTYNRPKGVFSLLDDLARQTVLPEFIYVVDQSSGTSIQEATEEARQKHPNLVGLVHLKVDFQGLTKSRNYGLARVVTPIATFIDDDVQVGSTYIEEALKFFSTHDCAVVSGLPQAPGVVHRGSEKPSKLWSVYRQVFQMSRPGSSWSVLPNFEVTYDSSIQVPTRTQYISGSNFSVFTDLAKDIGFDENLFYYSIGEDIDFPVRILRKKPGKVWLDPTLPVFHPSAPEKSWSGFIYFVHSVHHYYLFYKYWNQTPPLTAYIDFIRSRIGESLLSSLQQRKMYVIPDLSLLRSSAMTELKILYHLNDVIKGKFPKWD